MKQILDLHIHSKYSRACSPQLSLKNIDQVARQKGIDIIATGDFTYPAWFKSLETELVEINNSGLYKLKTAADNKIKFILSTEISLIYKDNNLARRIHLVIHAPNLEAVRKLNKVLEASYNIYSDGRPILGLSAPKFCKLCFEIDPNFLIYPAHIWTPWYSVFGSRSGFNSLQECFQEYTNKIYAIETGLSSDPEMNWRLSALDNLTILSSSDAHSLENLGREATVMKFTDEPSYQKIYDNIKYQQNIEFTIEFYPEEGMYYFDGHRNCSFSCSPEESLKLNGICPICYRPLVIGVSSRISQLADRPQGYKLTQGVPFKKIIGLAKIIAEIKNVKSRQSQKVKKEYNRLINEFGSEFFILLEVDLKKITPPILAEAINRVRSGNLNIKPGYDGQYGEVKIFSK